MYSALYIFATASIILCNTIRFRQENARFILVRAIQSPFLHRIRTFSAPSIPSHTSTMNHNEILALEHKTWDALCISGSTLIPLLSDDCIMVFPGGMKLSKESHPTLSSILASEEFVPWSSYTILESETRTLDGSAQSALICYKVSARRVSDRDSQSFDALCSSVWRKIGPEQWEMVFHQQTPL